MRIGPIKDEELDVRTRESIDIAREIEVVCDELAEMLVAKNKAYGNSALDPVKIFSRIDAEEQIKCRIDDKLSRIKRGSEYQGDDTLKDLAGYLILLMVLRKQNSDKQG